MIPRMLRRLAVPLILVVAILAASSGLLRLRFDTDILSMMPPDLPEVKGLKAFHQAFSRDNELIMLIEGGEADEGSMPAAAGSLAKHMEADGAVKRARWKPRWSDEPEGIAELLAYLWLNGDPAATAAQAERLSPARSEAKVKESLGKIGTAMEGLSMVMLAHDPFGFLDHPAVTQLTSSEQGGEAFESPDGRAHLLFAEAPGEGDVLLGREGQLGIDLVHAGAQRCALQVELGGVLGQAGDWGRKGQAKRSLLQETATGCEGKGRGLSHGAHDKAAKVKPKYRRKKCPLEAGIFEKG